MATQLTDTRPVTTGLVDLARREGQKMLEEVLRRHKEIPVYGGKPEYTTGQTSRTLKIVPKEDGFELRGWKYAGTYEEGRKPGGMPPVEAIVAWIKAKGLTFDKPGGAEHYAWAIARSIAKRGTRRYWSSQADIFTTPISEMTARLVEEETEYLAMEIKRTLLRTDIKNE